MKVLSCSKLLEDKPMESQYTKDALIRFLDIAVSQGLVNQNTAAGWKAASHKVLEDIGLSDDIRTVDVQTAVLRYNNRHPGELRPASLKEYKRRVSLVIEEFIRYTDDPANYTPRSKSIGSSKAAKQPNSKPKKTSAPKNLPPSTRQDEANSLPPSSTPQAGLAYSYPLRQNFLAQIVLPRDLSAEEALRLSRFIETLALDFKPK